MSGIGEKLKTAFELEEEARERLQYYGDADIIPSDNSFFSFELNDNDMTAEAHISNIDSNGIELLSLILPYKYIDESGNEYLITSIGSAIGDNVNLANIILPNSVTVIGEGAFYIAGLFEITIPNSITQISDIAFMGCKHLFRVTIPDSVRSIGTSAFYACNLLTYITIPDSVDEIGNTAFAIHDYDAGIDVINPNLKIICNQGSYAETYAKENNISYTLNTISQDSLDSVNETANTALTAVINLQGTVDENYQTLNEKIGDLSALYPADQPSVVAGMNYEAQAREEADMALLGQIDSLVAEMNTADIALSEEIDTKQDAVKIGSLEIEDDTGNTVMAETVVLEHNTVYYSYLPAEVLNVEFPDFVNSTFDHETYISSFIFESLSPATALTYPSEIIMSGDDCIDGVFTPIENKRYEVIVWYDGMLYKGVVRGDSI